MSEKKEILERVLLLMKYSNEMTLGENLLTIKEQIAQDFRYEKETKKEEWVPNSKKVKNFLGGEFDVPKQAQTFNFVYKLKPSKLYPIDGQEKIGGDIVDFVYIKNLKSANPFFTKYFSDSSFDNRKFYYPSKNALTSYFGNSVYEFDIPKGTPKPYDRNVKNEDDWLSDRQQGEELTDKVHTFRATKKIEKTDINLALTPKENSMHGWKYLPGYYTRDIISDKLVSYVPELWIQYKSPLVLWWDEYGLYVELVGGLVLSILSAGIASAALAAFEITSVSAATLSFYLDLVLNGIFNLSIASMYLNGHDNETAFINIFFAFLPILGKFSSSIKSIMANAKLSEDLLKSATTEILQKLGNTSLGKDKKLWQLFYKSLSEPTRKVMKVALSIPESELKSVIPRAIKFANGRLAQVAKQGVFGFSKFIVKKGSAALGKFFAKGAIDIGLLKMVESSFERILGRKLTAKENISILTVISANAEANNQTVEVAAQEYVEKVESGEISNEQLSTDLNLQVSDSDTQKFTEQCDKILSKKDDDVL